VREGKGREWKGGRGGDPRVQDWKNEKVATIELTSIHDIFSTEFYVGAQKI